MANGKSNLEIVQDIETLVLAMSKLSPDEKKESVGKIKNLINRLNDESYNRDGGGNVRMALTGLTGAVENMAKRRTKNSRSESDLIRAALEELSRLRHPLQFGKDMDS